MATFTSVTGLSGTASAVLTTLHFSPKLTGTASALTTTVASIRKDDVASVHGTAAATTTVTCALTTSKVSLRGTVSATLTTLASLRKNGVGSLRGTAAATTTALQDPKEVDVSLQPLTSFSANYAYGDSRASLQPLTAEGDSGLIVESFAIVEGVFYPLSGYGHCLTGGLGQGSVTFKYLWAMASDRPYAAAAPTLEALTTEGYGTIPDVDLVLSFSYAYVTYNVSADSQAQATSTTTIAKVITASEGSTAIASSSASATCTLTLESGSGAVGVSSTYILGEEYETWAFTLDSEHTPGYRYEGFNFNSFARLVSAAGDRYYGADESGIHELSGSTDNGTPIPSSIITGRHAEGSEHLQQVVTGYLAGTSAGQLVLRVVTETGAIYSYTAEAALGTNPTRQRVKLGRGLKSHFWQLEVKNQNGEDFDLMGVDVLPVVLKRRIK
jgi:hypothetical protein